MNKMKTNTDAKVPLARALTMLIMLGIVTEEEIKEIGNDRFEGLDKLLESKMNYSELFKVDEGNDENLI